MKYIQNTRTSGIEIKVRDVSGRDIVVAFERYRTNKLTGQVESNGFTEVNDDVFKALEGNKAFCVCKDKGWLVVHKEAPLVAGSFEQMLEARARIKELEEENNALKAQLAAYQKGAAPAEDPVSYDDMNYNELRSLAKKRGIEDAPSKKTELIEALKAWDAAQE